MRRVAMIHHKMRSPAFPPRRPSAIVRYLVPSMLIISFFYYFSAPRDRTPSIPVTYANPMYINDMSPSQMNHKSKSGSGKSSEHASPAGGQAAKDQPKFKQPDALSPQEPITHQEDKQNKGDKPPPVTDHTDKPSTGNSNPQQQSQSHSQSQSQSQSSTKGGPHPIDRLIDVADKQFADTMSQESHTLAEAAAAYRKKRGRHPPPGFDVWYNFAAERNAVMVESFWDQVYHDLEPFWALPPAEIRKGAWDYEMTINVRNGRAWAQSDWFWTQIWLSMIQSIEHMLPDMDIALNAMDEPRLVVPWEQMSEYMNKASAARAIVPAKDAIGDFERLPNPGEGDDKDVKTPEPKWEGTKPFWKLIMRGCAPDSATRKAEVMEDFNHAPTITASLAEPHMYKGYVSNFTLSTDFCHQPDLQGLNGIFIEPQTVAASKTLFPMFGGSKLAVNNEILLPAPMYWNEEERFTGGGKHGVEWARKFDDVVWRGVATGGRNRETNWRAFQRHRFVAMNNGTKISRAEDWTELPVNFELPSKEYELAAQQPVTQGLPRTHMGKWVDSWADVAFVDLMCAEETEGGQCHYTSPHFRVEEGIRLAEQFNWKYLPDIDGNSFSGRYLGFLRSTSLPIKSTVWREWHDSRLVAWKHFVPMDNRYGDWYGIMDYFLGYQDEETGEVFRKGHDRQAEKIARDGQEWAEKVLRKEDMQIYTLRLLLEYARVSDPRREKMGFVKDLLDSEKASAASAGGGSGKSKAAS